MVMFVPSALGRVGLATAALDRDPLRLQHFVCSAYMQAAASSILRVNASEPCRIGLEPLFVLDARARVLVLDDEVRLGRIERQQLASRELVIEPVDRAVLQVGERIVLGGAGQLVLAEHGLLLPGVDLIGRVFGKACRSSSRRAPWSVRRSPRPTTPLVSMTWPLTWKPRDQEAVARVFQVLEHRARVLPHQDGVRRIVVDAELIADAVLLADAVQRDPGPGA